MSVFNVLTARVSSGGEKLTLDEVLSSKQYQMIYLMLGINELGYDMSQTTKQYEEVLDKIKEMQPEAIMVLEANLHITSEKSEKSPVYSNSKINRLNQEIQKIAEENSCYYIDVNEIFDDDGGSLNQAYSTDGSHVLGRYYAEWVKWLKEEI
jgi:lysophospholipase L1-like esterase